MRVDPLQVLTKLAAAQNIPTRRVTPPFDGLEEFDYGLRRSLDPQFDWQEFGRLLLEQTPAQTLLFAPEPDCRMLERQILHKFQKLSPSIREIEAFVLKETPFLVYSWKSRPA